MDARTICGCAASPMSTTLSDSSTQLSSRGITTYGWRDTAPALSSKKRNLGGDKAIRVLQCDAGSSADLGSISPSLYLIELNEAVGSQLSSAPCLDAGADLL
jgi:hypothetical protein